MMIDRMLKAVEHSARKIREGSFSDKGF